jgi:hypothetical protein
LWNVLRFRHPSPEPRVPVSNENGQRKEGPRHRNLTARKSTSLPFW